MMLNPAMNLPGNMNVNLGFVGNVSDYVGGPSSSSSSIAPDLNDNTENSHGTTYISTISGRSVSTGDERYRATNGCGNDGFQLSFPFATTNQASYPTAMSQPSFSSVFSNTKSEFSQTRTSNSTSSVFGDNTIGENPSGMSSNSATSNGVTRLDSEVPRVCSSVTASSSGSQIPSGLSLGITTEGGSSGSRAKKNLHAQTTGPLVESRYAAASFCASNTGNKSRPTTATKSSQGTPNPLGCKRVVSRLSQYGLLNRSDPQFSNRPSQRKSVQTQRKLQFGGVHQGSLLSDLFDSTEISLLRDELDGALGDTEGESSSAESREAETNASEKLNADSDMNGIENMDMGYSKPIPDSNLVNKSMAFDTKLGETIQKNAMRNNATKKNSNMKVYVGMGVKAVSSKPSGSGNRTNAGNLLGKPNPLANASKPRNGSHRLLNEFRDDEGLGDDESIAGEGGKKQMCVKKKNRNDTSTSTIFSTPAKKAKRRSKPCAPYRAFLENGEDNGHHPQANAKAMKPTPRGEYLTRKSLKHIVKTNPPLKHVLKTNPKVKRVERIDLVRQGSFDLLRKGTFATVSFPSRSIAASSDDYLSTITGGGSILNPINGRGSIFSNDSTSIANIFNQVGNSLKIGNAFFPVSSVHPVNVTEENGAANSSNTENTVLPASFPATALTTGGTSSKVEASNTLEASAAGGTGGGGPTTTERLKSTVKKNVGEYSEECDLSPKHGKEECGGILQCELSPIASIASTGLTPITPTLSATLFPIRFSASKTTGASSTTSRLPSSTNLLVQNFNLQIQSYNLENPDLASLQKPNVQQKPDRCETGLKKDRHSNQRVSLAPHAPDDPPRAPRKAWLDRTGTKETPLLEEYDNINSPPMNFHSPPRNSNTLDGLPGTTQRGVSRLNAMTPDFGDRGGNEIEDTVGSGIDIPHNADNRAGSERCNVSVLEPNLSVLDDNKPSQDARPLRDSLDGCTMPYVLSPSFFPPKKKRNKGTGTGYYCY